MSLDTITRTRRCFLVFVAAAVCFGNSFVGDFATSVADEKPWAASKKPEPAQ